MFSWRAQYNRTNALIEMSEVVVKRYQVFCCLWLLADLVMDD